MGGDYDEVGDCIEERGVNIILRRWEDIILRRRKGSFRIWEEILRTLDGLLRR